jgi:heme/copper-type cytochrome/quinol oxidase subunit 2
MKSLSKFAFGLFLLVAAMRTASAIAQGCAMCKANAAATPKDAQHAINRAIFVMIVPPIGIMLLGAGFVVRYARKRDQELDDKEDEAL